MEEEQDGAECPGITGRKLVICTDVSRRRVGTGLAFAVVGRVQGVFGFLPHKYTTAVGRGVTAQSVSSTRYHNRGLIVTQSSP